MSILNQLANLYPVTKTITMALKPINETAKYLEDFGSDKLKDSVNSDMKISDDAKVVKDIMDHRFRDVVTACLSDFKSDEFDALSNNLGALLLKFRESTGDVKKELRKEIELAQLRCRQIVANCFAPAIPFIKPKTAVASLPQWALDNLYSDDDAEMCGQFKKSVGYFTKYFSVRSFLFSDEDKHNTLSNRLVNENMSSYLANCNLYAEFYETHDVLDVPAHPLAIKLNYMAKKGLFNPPSYSSNLTQDSIDEYNTLLSGSIDSERAADKGINVLIREYRAENKLSAKNLPLFKKLDALLLFGTKPFDFLNNKTDSDVIADVERLCKTTEQTQMPAFVSSTRAMIKSDLDGVFVMPRYFNSISNSCFKAFDVISAALKFAKVNPKDPVSINILDASVMSYYASLTKIDRHFAPLDSALLNDRPILSHFSLPLMDLQDKVLKAISKAGPVIKAGLIKGSRRPPKTLDNDDKGGKGFFQLQSIQNVFKALQALISHYRPLLLEKGRKTLDVMGSDADFYESFTPALKLMDEEYFTSERLVRTHFTKKPSKGQKVKLSFDNPNLMGGWSSTTTAGTGSVMLEKDGLYYLAICSNSNRSAFDFNLNFDDHLNGKLRTKKLERQTDAFSDDDSGYNLFIYNQITGFSMSAPRVFLWAQKRRDFFNPSDEVLEIANTSSFTLHGKPKSGFNKKEFNLKDCHTMIDYFKDCIALHPVWNKFNFVFSDTSTYQTIEGFYREVDAQSYKLTTQKIKNDYIQGLIDNEDVFMFQVTNKDFLPAANGTPNLFTKYFKAIFNTSHSDNSYKLNGGAEMFYKKHTIKAGDEVIHAKGSVLTAKNPNTPNQTRIAPFDIIKDRNATRDSFTLNFSFTANSDKTKLTVKNHNDIVDELLVENSDKMNVLAITRGERNLLSYAVVNKQHQVIDSGNLNSITNHGTGVKTDYLNLLNNKLDQYKLAQKSWGTADGLKGFKSGFLSQAIPLIVDLALKHNAFICIEDLSGSFTDKRKAIDANVYESFDTKLAAKLNFLVIKSIEDNKPAGTHKALQLAQPTGIDDYFRSGILVKVSPAYTTKTCPRTGFVNLLHFKYQNIKKSSSFMECFTSLSFNTKSKLFDIAFDYNNFKLIGALKLKSYQTQWVASTHGHSRYYYDPIKKESNEFDATDALSELFSKHDIDWMRGTNILDDICAVESAPFYKQLFNILGSLFSIKQYKAHSPISFAISPIADENGGYYSSEHAKYGEACNCDTLACVVLAKKAWWSMMHVVDGGTKFPFVSNDVFFNEVI